MEAHEKSHHLVGKLGGLCEEILLRLGTVDCKLGVRRSYGTGFVF